MIEIYIKRPHFLFSIESLSFFNTSTTLPKKIILQTWRSFFFSLAWFLSYNNWMLFVYTIVFPKVKVHSGFVNNPQTLVQIISRKVSSSMWSFFFFSLRLLFIYLSLFSSRFSKSALASGDKICCQYSNSDCNKSGNKDEILWFTVSFY